MAKYILHHFVKVATEFTPQTIARLTTIGPMFKAGGETRQVYVCICGEIICTRVSSVVCGATTSCGCRRSEDVRKRRTYHGYATAKPSEYRAWKTVRQRCLNSKCKDYPSYGGRGIYVCARWLEPKGQGFINFLADMGPKPLVKGKRFTVNRKENDGPYSPENCEWADDPTQANNRRSNIFIEFAGRRMTASQWDAHLNLPRNSVSRRLRAGLSIEGALAPVRRRKPQ